MCPLFSVLFGASSAKIRKTLLAYVQSRNFNLYFNVIINIYYVPLLQDYYVLFCFFNKLRAACVGAT